MSHSNFYCIKFFGCNSLHLLPIINNPQRTKIPHYMPKDLKASHVYKQGATQQLSMINRYNYPCACTLQTTSMSHSNFYCIKFFGCNSLHLLPIINNPQRTKIPHYMPKDLKASHVYKQGATQQLSMINRYNYP